MRVKAVSTVMGYILQETRTSVTYNQVKVTAVMGIKSTGVAPFYATQPLEAIPVDKNNEIVTTQIVEPTPSSILLDQTGEVTARLLLPEKLWSSDFAQRLTVMIYVESPLLNSASVTFANETMNKPLPGCLGLGRFTQGRASKN